LFQHGILPYYLHLLDKATGTGHFAVSELEALSIMNSVQARLSGYIVPKLVKEVAGFTSKQYVTDISDASRTLSEISVFG
jgi:L-lysine 2,3-aminomutase